MIGTLLAIHALLQPGSTEVTVYNQGLGFIKDVRTLKLRKGTQNIVVEDVAQMIDATSVGFKCLNNPGSVSILEQNYQYDLISPEAILQKSVGKRIRFTRTMGTQKESVEGVLLNSPTSVVNNGDGPTMQYNGLVIRTDDGRILLSPEGEIDVLEMPEGLISKPSLLWQVDSDRDQDAKMELSYLTQGMKWSANYVLTMGDSGSADLQGWVTLDNQSGVSFDNATLKLLAGDVNVVQNALPLAADGIAIKAAPAAKAPMSEESLFEYHLYTLDRPATVKNKETKQLSLLEGFNIPVQKVLYYEGYANMGGNEDESKNEAAQVRIKFINDKKSNLGMPMPAGKMRLYQRDSKGSVQFLGEDMINHTPKDEKISLEVGTAFDVRIDRKPTNYVKLGRDSKNNTNAARISYELEVRNHKEEPVTVYLYEHESGDWRVVEKSQDYIKDDASTIVFEVRLAAGETKKVTYSVESKW
ncbi:MAG: DUF4139 domain-containing protein [Armatimonadetes bacterium]|nr:DUF4139 domain-containing protein [Armatimonadota bacterium]